MFPIDYILVCLICFGVMAYTIHYSIKKSDSDEGEGGIPEDLDPTPDAPQPAPREREFA